MDRVFESGAAGLAPAAPASPSTGFPTGGNPSGGVPATKPGPYWFHMVTEELRAVIVAAGLTPDHLALNQLASAISTLVASAGVSSYNGIQVLPATDVRKTVLFAGGTANATFTLPTLSSVPVGGSITIKHATSGSFVLTVQRAGTDSILTGSSTITSFTMSIGDTVTLVNSTSGWMLMGGSVPLRYATGAFGASLAAAGYQRLPSGLILQWFDQAVTNVPTDYSFPLAFPTAGLKVFIVDGEATAASITFGGNITSATQYRAVCSAASVLACVFAIGY